MNAKGLIAIVVGAVIIIGVLVYSFSHLGTPTTTSNSSLDQLTNASSAPALTPYPATLSAQVSKLLVQDVKVGTGSAVKSGDTITVNYTGTLMNGTVFDSSNGHGPFTTKIGVGQVIQGWDQGLIGMKVGGVRKLTIPASLAYGNQSAGSIPPNSPLIFQIELLGVKE